MFKYLALALLLTIPGVTMAQNPCALYESLRTSPNPGVVKVQVLGAQQGIVGVMILGLPKKLNVSLNGIDVSHLTSDKQQIVCGRGAIGELRSYDLRALKISGGYFQVQADSCLDGMSVSCN